MSSSPSRGSELMEYRRIEGVEWIERYEPGGYHPVQIGDILINRYRIVHKLGHGTFATVWLALDQKSCAYVAVKIATADSENKEASILRTIGKPAGSGSGSRCQTLITTVLDEFEIQGPNGRHQCYVTVAARGSVSRIGRFSIFQLEAARALAAQLALAVAYVHSQGFAHGDIHPGNILIKLPRQFDLLSVDQLYKSFGKPFTEPVVRIDEKPLPSGVPTHGISSIWFGKKAKEIPLEEARLILGDFGESFSPSKEHRTGDDCHAPLSSMPPEAFFAPETPISFSTDLWTLACAIWSLLTPNPLFNASFATVDEVVMQQVDIIGPLPSEWWDTWEERSEYFDETGQPTKDREVDGSLELVVEDSLQKSRRDRQVGELCKEETAALTSMLRSMLKFKPEERITAEQVLESEWMRKWALPEFEKIPVD
ncbi:Serine/threonine-protein kinase SRPK-like protein [Cladobotryum mycophilum]|uniref:non-specific serine/threonine protein kinase n=1 Tax=Cladobotryum mycophilum TaxID=491253 RepID=A0ABR0T3I4_9HYPO